MPKVTARINNNRFLPHTCTHEKRRDHTLDVIATAFVVRVNAGVECIWRPYTTPLTARWQVKGKGNPVLVSERRARDWPRCTGSQPAGHHPPGGRLAAITFRQACGYLPSRRAPPPAGWYQSILLGDRDRCVCEQLAQGCYLEADWPRFEPATTFWIARERSNVTPHRPSTTCWQDTKLNWASNNHRKLVLN